MAMSSLYSNKIYDNGSDGYGIVGDGYGVVSRFFSFIFFLLFHFVLSNFLFFFCIFVLFYLSCSLYIYINLLLYCAPCIILHYIQCLLCFVYLYVCFSCCLNRIPFSEIAFDFHVSPQLRIFVLFLFLFSFLVFFFFRIFILLSIQERCAQSLQLCRKVAVKII